MFEERGIRTLFLAVGMAHWTETTSAAQPAAPVILFPLELRPEGSTAEEFEVQTVGDPQVSPTLLEKLATDFGLRLNANELDDLLLGDAPHAHRAPATPISRRLMLQPVTNRARSARPGTAAPPRARHGLADRRAARAADEGVRRRGPGLHDRRAHRDRQLLLPQAPDGEDLESVRRSSSPTTSSPRSPATRRPGPPSRRGRRSTSTPAARPPIPRPTSTSCSTPTARQSYAINAVLAGSNLDRQGPARHRQEPDDREPDRLARRPRPAGAVRRREAGRDRRRAQAPRRRGPRPPRARPARPAQSRRAHRAGPQAALDASPSTPLVDLAAQQQALVARRDRLNRYTEALHRVRDPWGESLFAIFRALPEVDGPARIAYRFPAPLLTTLDRDRAGEAAQAIRDFVGLGGYPAPGRSPWAGARLASPDDVRAALDAVAKLRAEVPAVASRRHPRHRRRRPPPPVDVRRRAKERSRSSPACSRRSPPSTRTSSASTSPRSPTHLDKGWFAAPLLRRLPRHAATRSSRAGSGATRRRRRRICTPASPRARPGDRVGRAPGRREPAACRHRCRRARRRDHLDRRDARHARDLRPRRRVDGGPARRAHRAAAGPRRHVRGRDPPPRGDAPVDAHRRARRRRLLPRVRRPRPCPARSSRPRSATPG